MSDSCSTTNDLFWLGWLEKPDLASKGLGALSRKAEGYTDDRGVCELDTQAIFVEPLLRGLGWETLDHNQVDRAPTGKHPDIQLWAKDGQSAKRVVIIEVKPWRQSDKDGWQHQRAGRPDPPYKQLKGYALARLTGSEAVIATDGEPILYGAVTNGARWVIYKFDRNVVSLEPSQHTPVCGFDVRDPDVPGLLDHVGRSALMKRFNLL